MKKLYNWLHRFYGIAELSLESSVRAAVDAAVSSIPDTGNKTAIEYACGSGLLSLKLAEYFSNVEGRDASRGMLGRAKTRMNKTKQTVVFSEGDILSINDSDKSFDWAFVSFALHLFSPEDEKTILFQLFRISREGVIIIDHSKKWNLFAACIERLEGSYYDTFIKTDFASVAEEIGCSSFKEMEINHSSVMIFLK